VADSALLQTFVRKIDLPESEPGAMLMKRSERITLELSETDGTLHALLALKAIDEGAAGRMTDNARGLIALVSLKQDVPEMASLGQQLSVTRDGARTAIQLKVSADKVIAAMKDHAARGACATLRQPEWFV